jgi:predicted HTH domain antitoxin
MTQIAVELPDDLAHRLGGNGQDLSRRVLEALAVEAYRAGDVTAAEVQRMLGHSSRWETDAFLKEHQAYLRYTKADLEAELEAVQSYRQS